jgi:DNA repair protein RadA/Sms
MAKTKEMYECEHCGEQSIKWLGKCPACGGWDSFIKLSKEQVENIKEQQKHISKNIGGKTSNGAEQITKIKDESITRFSSQSKEFDLVLGGGIVPGSLSLIGGSPGIGKSTLLLKISGELAKNKKKVLYVSGEESKSQIKLRASRLKCLSDNLYLFCNITLESIFEEMYSSTYDIVVIDSIQTIYSDKLSSAPGSVSQIREITFALMRFAKQNNIAMFLIGHITKDGLIAGPRVLEHMVDVVLYFEGDSNSDIRMLRGFKNRFGSTSEIGIFEMREEGLVSASDINSKFFTQNNKTSGACLSVTMEGSRALIIEVEALVSTSYYPNPKRSSTGFELNRLNMILALLEKKLGISINDKDIFVNISGGIKIKEGSCDLAVMAAIISSLNNRVLSKQSVFIGELGLTGVIKDVPYMGARLNEAYANGVAKAIIKTKPKELKNNKIKCFEINEVDKLIEFF